MKIHLSRELILALLYSSEPLRKGSRTGKNYHLHITYNDFNFTLLWHLHFTHTKEIGCCCPHFVSWAYTAQEIRRRAEGTDQEQAEYDSELADF